MHLRFAIAILLLPVTAVQAQHAGHAKQSPSKQISTLASRNANQALDMTTMPSAPMPQPILPGTDAKVQPGIFDNPALNDPPPPDRAQAYDPGSIHYPYGRTSLGNVDPASRANPYGPYSTDTGYGHYSGPALPQTPTLFGNPAPAFGINTPAFGVNNTPAFIRGR